MSLTLADLPAVIRGGGRPSGKTGQPGGSRSGRTTVVVRRPGLTRRGIQVALGLLWILDGALQLQPFMFTRRFATQVIAPSASGQPSWVAWPVLRGAEVIGTHPAAVDTVFAVVQLALGVAFLVRRSAAAAAVVSVAWSLGVWVVGEGLGGLAGGTATLLDGAPGAALLYAVLAAAAWPGRRSSAASRGSAPERVAGWFPAAWALLWTGFAVLALLPANRSAAAVASLVRSNAGQVPAWLAAADRSVGWLAADGGTACVGILVVVPLAVGLSGLGRRRSRVLAAWTGVGLAVLVWAFGESFGYLVSGTATDPNTGPLLVVAALALLGCSEPVSAVPARSPAATATGAPMASTVS